MTDNQRENLSAGMDGELSKEELRFLLRRIDHDAALQQAWSRYHVARDGLRRQLPPLASDGFATRVMQAVEQEHGVIGKPRRHWLHWSAGGAIAAGVAVAALMVAQPAGQPDQLSPQVASAPAKAIEQDSAALANTGMGAPAVAPPGLNVYSDVPYHISQRASATLDGDSHSPLYSRNSLSPYRVARYPANSDGSYLLLIHPDQAQQPSAQAPATPQ
jgi:sigma-E factor negative regulatory protein RseA